MAGKNSKGTPLKVFSGKEEPLNRLVLLILCNSKQPFTKYDMAIEVKRVTEFKRTDKNTVYRRMEALQEQEFISVVGERKTKPGWPSELYAITQRGIAALKAINIEEFILTASYEELRKFNDSLP